MLTFLVRRLVSSVFVLVGVSTMVFFALRLTGDPAALLLQEGNPTQADVQELRRVLDLDKPLPDQYAGFITKAVRGDFGRSFRYRTPALALVLERLPATLELAGAAMAVALLLAFPLGTISAVSRGTAVDFATRTISLLGASLPNFWLGLMLILLFAVRLRWLPASGYGEPRFLILPAITLGTALAGLLARLIRSSLLDILGAEYVRTARAKGLGERAVLIRHALRNALIPVVTVMGLQFGSLLGGSVIVETVFSWPGVGRLIVDSIGLRDYPVVQAGVLLLATFFIVANLAVDLMYAVLDPRISHP